jgi:hypothetical protein
MSDTPSTIYEALEAFKRADVNRYGRAKRFLGANLTTLKTEADFTAAYDGYKCCVEMLPKEWHPTLKMALQGLDSYVKARSQVTPDEWLNATRESLDKLLTHLKSHLSIEAWNAAGSIVEGLFDQIAKGGNS